MTRKVIEYGSIIEINDGSTLTNNGLMYAGGPGSSYAYIIGDVVNNSFLMPCDNALSSGELQINGDFTAGVKSELMIRIHGTSAKDYDRLNVWGEVMLDGELAVQLTDDFVPEAGDTFSVIDYSARDGEFTIHTFDPLPEGLEWQLTYEPDGVVLAVIDEVVECPADITGDGVVDVLDLLQVLSQWGGSGTADITGDGVVDVLDLLEVLSAWGPCA